MRRALVTGGSGGIGEAVAHELAAMGLHVVVHAHTRIERAESVAAAIRDGGGSAESLAFDVADADAATAALARVLHDGPVQVVVNNAGIHDDATMAGMSHAQWRRVLAVSLDGFFNVTQPLLLPMLRTRWGRIVSVSSISAVLGNRGQTNYAAAKAGLHGATRSLAREVASRGVTVNAVAPGIIEGPAAAAVGDERIAQVVPMKRAGRAEEVAALVGFLASERAGYLTGQVIGLNGGMG